MPSKLPARAYRWVRLRLPQPWSRWFGQLAYLPRILRGHDATRREFAEEAEIERILGSTDPIDGVGTGLSERVVEIPWVLRRLGGRGNHVLDIGAAFSPMVYKRLLARRLQPVEVADLVAANIPGVKSHVADVRALPFANDSFDVAVCISTLEHIGMDNTQYGIERGGGGDVSALRELGRVAPLVFVTVPAGRDEDMGWQRQYSPSRFRRVVDEAGLKVVRLDVFAHDVIGGWSPANEDSIGERSYGEGAVAAAASICAELARK